jgi:hypothetical protein
VSKKTSRVQFDETTHTYTLDGVELPSVTHIIRYLAVNKANNADPNMALIARERGSAVHEATVMYDYSGEIPDDFPAEYAPYLKAYVQFVRDYAPNWILTEYRMANETLGFAGTLDRFGVIDGYFCILDIKTSYKVDILSLSAQLTAYHDLLLNDKPEKIGDRGIRHLGLQLMKNGKYRLYECDAKQGSELFYSCRNIYRIERALKGVRMAVSSL